MKPIFTFSILLFIFMTITSCESQYNLSIVAPKKAVLNDKVEISLSEENDFPIEEVTFFVNGNEILSEKKVIYFRHQRVWNRKVNYFCNGSLW